jgi:starvation-inducible DNA-binding protein
MATAIKMKPSKIALSDEPIAAEIGIDQKARKALADGLGMVLASTYTLLGKTHGYHWNVTGPQVPGLHPMFEAQYEDLEAAVDTIAERIRALGFFAPGSLTEFLRLSRIEDDAGSVIPDAQAMCRQLAEDNELAARTCREVVQICEKSDATATEDLLNGRIAAHEKAAWMLRASLES